MIKNTHSWRIMIHKRSTTKMSDSLPPFPHICTVNKCFDTSLCSFCHLSLSLSLPSFVQSRCCSLSQLRPATERREAPVSRALSATYRLEAARDREAERARAQSAGLFPPLRSRDSGEERQQNGVCKIYLLFSTLWLLLQQRLL